MEHTNYYRVIEQKTIDEDLYNKLNELGMLPNEVRKGNIGKSNYSKQFIQPWSIWKDYNLNPWDADIVKRILRTKEEPGMSEVEARIMDYQKIKHICDERIRQLELEPKVTYASTISDDPNPILGPGSLYLCPDAMLTNATIQISNPHTDINYSLQNKEIEQYNEFCEKHRNCKGSVQTCFSHESGIGVTVKMRCPGCGEEKDITDVSNW